MAKRSRIDIIEDMLQLMNKGKGVKKTHLMYKSNLSHQQLKSYLEELVDKDFVAKTQNKNCEYIIITPNGRKFLEKIREMKEFENAFGLKN